MRSRIKLLSLTVGATVVLLAIGAVLVVLGTFNEYLHWDIFSPEVEKFLYGIFFSCLSLGGFGVAISTVLGIQEVVQALRRMIEAASPGAIEPAKPAPRRSYVAVLAALLVLLVGTILVFNAVNHRVKVKRLQVFKLVVRDQMLQLGPHLEGETAKIQAPCPTCATPSLPELMKTLGDLSFCQWAVLYMADPADKAVLWRYPAGGRYTSYDSETPAKFERFFVASDVDRAIAQALGGDTAWIDQMNGAPDFNWTQVIRDGQGKIRAVLKIYGNPNESYRDYQAVAQAAAKRKKT
ncbi:MAG TPA: hypothetical protein VLB76_08055 [Thermoanaerobaculia bacterium]|jgi:hypothetical protein|nr:hypothetical protein [Thermoanaerobaculia bacterium]